MTPVISPLLKAHITRFKGSRGSGTDLGRTTVSAVGGLVKPTAGSCPWANGASHNDRTTSAELPILRPGGVFNVPTIFASAGTMQPETGSATVSVPLFGVSPNRWGGRFQSPCAWRLSSSLSHGCVFLLQALEEALEQAAVCFLIGLQFDGEILRHVIPAVASFDDLLVTGDGLVLGVAHALDDAQHVSRINRWL